MLEQAAGEVNQITELIDEVLFLSELESGARVVALGAEPVRPVLEDTLDELAERAERAGIELSLECDPELELTIRPRMLRVVARNLAENAIRYAGPDASFTLAVEREPTGVIQLVGRDDGAGVEESELPRLFERFYRADHARASRGTGLGLAIVKHVVTQAGGTVEASGGRGKGLEIRCSFPPRVRLHRIVTVSSPLAPRRELAAGETGGHEDASSNRDCCLHRAVCARRGGLWWRRRRRRRWQCGGTITADGSSTVGPFATRAAEDFRAENPDVDVTVGISGTGGGFERFCAGETDISDASRPIDEEEAAVVRGERRRVRRAPGRHRRADEHREHRERLGDVPDGRAARRRSGGRSRR